MEQNTNEPMFELQVDYDSGNAFKEGAKWARFIAIVYFIVLALCAAGLVFASAFIMEFFASVQPELAALGGIAFAIIVAVIAVYIFTSILLFRFASLVKQGIERQDQHTFNEGLKALKNYFLVVGIIAILSILFNVLGLVNTISGGSIFNFNL